MKLNDFKRGDTFSLIADITDANGNALVYDIAKIRSQVRTSNDRLISILEILTTDTNGRYILRALDTTKWPLEELLMDIEINDDGVVSSSSTITIPVVKDITRVVD